MGQVEKILPRLFKLKQEKTMSSDNQFTALGPAAVGFQTNGANITIGADISGSQEGVRGRCDAGVGVSGAGGIGVKGEGDRIGVFGVGTKSGTELTTGTGVQGESLDSNGVRGSSNLNDGVAGASGAIDKSGVFGFNSITEGEAFGVSGLCNSPQGAGVSGRNNSSGDAVIGVSSKGVGVRGRSDGNDGVVGTSNIAGKSGIFGFHPLTTGSSFGVSGTSASPTGAGINGFSDLGIGVNGASKSNDGIVGHSEGRGKGGVFGVNTGEPANSGGPGIATNVFGVMGRADSAAGIGVMGVSAKGIGVSCSGGSYGAELHGAHAPLRLAPSSIPNAPASGSHQIGELFVDSQGSLFFCKISGTPGTWVKVA